MFEFFQSSSSFFNGRSSMSLLAQVIASAFQYLPKNVSIARRFELVIIKNVLHDVFTCYVYSQQSQECFFQFQYYAFILNATHLINKVNNFKMVLANSRTFFHHNQFSNSSFFQIHTGEHRIWYTVYCIGDQCIVIQSRER